MKNILFYKYVPVHNPEEFCDDYLHFCYELGLKGKILIAKEGINGCVSGSDQAIRKFQRELTSDPRFADIEFKVDSVTHHSFKKMFVRVRKEIVTLKADVDLQNKAPYVEPTELKAWLDDHEDVILVDARNVYESMVGRFSGAVTPNIQLFSEWPLAVKQLHELKDRKIVTYCTGVIRCEKASAYLKEHGFNNVYQLRGGIIQYGKEVGADHWEGKCFVFDTRVAVDIDPKQKSEPITYCARCRVLTANHANCSNTICDRRFIACEDCLTFLDGCCSKACKHRKDQKVAV